ncbi:MAG: glycosyltransferase family 39 protein [Candidatus Margulisiibacteriota bacterium]
MKNKAIIFAFILFVLASLFYLPRNPLIYDDAALYALTAKNTIINNDWLAQYITPGDKTSFIDKPPLGIWMIALPMKILGVSELTVHIPNILYLFTLLGIMYLFLKKFSNKKVALYSILIAATSLGFILFSRTPKLDIPLTLFTTTGILSLYAYLKQGKLWQFYLFGIMAALGFLVKTGFGIIFPALTLLSIYLLSSVARNKLNKFVFSKHFIFLIIICTALIGSIISLQYISLQEQWIPYLKSITIQSKYNTSYLGFGFYYQIIGYILLAIFPWGAVCLPMLFKRINVGQALALHKISIRVFCLYWFWSGILFLLFFYKQNDLRTFVVFIPPLAILGGIRLAAFDYYSKRRLADILWNLFYMIVFTAIFIAMILKPVNQDGIKLNAVIEPLFWFVAFLYLLFIYLLRLNKKVFITSLFILVMGYATLFYNTPRIAGAFNPNLKWLGIIQEHRKTATPLFIYRPQDRNLFYSPDLFWVDFMAGPADGYFWDSASLKYAVKDRFSLILSDTKSLEKLGITYETFARDSYSSLVLTFGVVE